MTQQIKIGSLVKFYTILLLNEKPKHGYTLMKELKDKLGREISTSQVYPFLNLLKKKEFVKINNIGKREKKVYRLTKKGKNLVNSFLQRFGDLLYITIKPKLTICTHCGCKVYEGAHKEKINRKQLTFCCHHCANGYKKH